MEIHNIFDEEHALIGTALKTGCKQSYDHNLIRKLYGDITKTL